MKIRLLFAIFLCGVSLVTFAQNLTDTSIYLKEFAVKSTRLNVGLNAIDIDTSIMKLHETSSLSELLSQNTSVFIKTYGQGGLASSSFRGTGASHTQVLWNDFNINSPMLGELDFSTIPMFMIDEASIYYGGSSIVANSGSLGGSILLNNKIDWNKSLSVSALSKYGSFNSLTNALKAEVGNRKVRSVTRVFHAFSENSFTYINNTKEGFPEEMREDADYKTVGVMQELHFRIGKNDIFSSRIWMQQNDRYIPAPLVVKRFPDNEKREDSFVRSMAEWRHFGKKGKFNAKLAFLQDFMKYQNIISEINSENIVNSVQTKLRYDYSLSKSVSGFIGFSFADYQAETDNYEGNKDRKQVSGFAGVDCNLKEKLFGLLVFRQEWADQELIPLIPSLGLEYEMIKSLNWRLTGNISRNYHLPTLNELYWEPVGNPLLEPEEGVSYEFGTKMQIKVDDVLLIEPKVNAFYSNISNWILWYPNGNSNFWTPLNLREVDSKGLDCFLNLALDYKKLTAQYFGVFTYTKSTNQKETSITDQAVGKQLIYVPEVMANNTLRVLYNGYNAFYTSQYVSERYTTLDNLRFMPNYSIADFGIGKYIKFKRTSLSLSMKINNVFNVDYQAIAWQPMPGRHYSVSLQINYLK